MEANQRIRSFIRNCTNQLNLFPTTPVQNIVNQYIVNMLLQTEEQLDELNSQIDILEQIIRNRKFMIENNIGVNPYAGNNVNNNSSNSNNNRNYLADNNSSQFHLYFEEPDGNKTSLEINSFNITVQDLLSKFIDERPDYDTQNYVFLFNACNLMTKLNTRISDIGISQKGTISIIRLRI